MTILESTSERIKGKTNELSSGVQVILESDQSIGNLSLENLSGTKEVSVGVHEVSEAMQSVNDLNTKLGDAIEEIESGVAIFRTE